MTTRRSKKPIAPATNRFDGEVLGLVLFALGIFLAITVALPATGTGFMAMTAGALSGWLGWSAYLLPLIPAAFGVLVFLGRDLRGLTRRVLGGALVVLSLLCLHELARPGEAGHLASLLMTPVFRAASYGAVLLPIIALTLGLEVMFRLSPTLLLRRFFRAVSMMLAGGAGMVQSAVEARREGQVAAQARARLRGGLSAHSRDLETLKKLYPQARELSSWQQEAREAARTLGSLDEAALKAAEKQLAGWRDVSGGFVLSAGKELHGAVVSETPQAATQLMTLQADVKAGRHALATELPSTLASGALEGVRRALVMDLHRLSARAAALESARSKAEKRLEKPDAGVLLRELPAAEERRARWAELGAALSEWQGRAEHYPLWPDLTQRYDRAPTELAAEVAAALTRTPFVSMAESGVWEQRLKDGLAAAQAAETQPAPSLPVIDFGFDVDFDFAAPTPLPGSPAVPTFGVPKGRLAQVSAAPLPASPGAAEVGGPVSRMAATTVLVAQSAVSAGPAAPSARHCPPVAHVASAFPQTQSEQHAALGSRAGKGQHRACGPETRSHRHRHSRRRSARSDSRTAHRHRRTRPPGAAAGRTDQSDARAVRASGEGGGFRARPHRHALRDRTGPRREDFAHRQPVQRSGARAGGGRRACGSAGAGQERDRPGSAEHRPRARDLPHRRRCAQLPPDPREVADHPGQEHRRRPDGGRPRQDAAPADRGQSTGSGKSVCVNTLITSLLYRYLPTDLRFLMIDPKMVELTPYDGIPHLVRGVVTNPVDAAGVLLGAVAHMERRYKMMSQIGAKNLEQFNAKMRL